MKNLFFILVLLLFTPIFNNEVLGISKDGEMVCSGNVEREVQAYNEYKIEVQMHVDRIRALEGDQKAQEFFEGVLQNTQVGRSLSFQMDCLDSLGHDMETLDPVVVPEFHEIAIIVLASGIFGIIALSKKFGNRKAIQG